MADQADQFKPGKFTHAKSHGDSQRILTISYRPHRPCDQAELSRKGV